MLLPLLTAVVSIVRSHYILQSFTFSRQTLIHVQIFFIKGQLKDLWGRVWGVWGVWGERGIAQSLIPDALQSHACRPNA